MVDLPVVELDALRLAAGLTLGAVGIASSALFRAGRLRYLARYYWAEKMPFYARNHPFAFGPFGLGAICMGVALVATTSSDGSRDALLSLTLPGFFGFLLLGLFWAWRPPEFLKPTWLRHEEARRGRPQYPNALLDRALIGCLAVVVTAVFLVMALGAITKMIAWPF